MSIFLSTKQKHKTYKRERTKSRRNTCMKRLASPHKPIPDDKSVNKNSSAGIEHITCRCYVPYSRWCVWGIKKKLNEHENDEYGDNKAIGSVTKSPQHFSVMLQSKFVLSFFFLPPAAATLSLSLPLLISFVIPACCWSIRINLIRWMECASKSTKKSNFNNRISSFTSQANKIWRRPENIRSQFIPYD